MFTLDPVTILLSVAIIFFMAILYSKQKTGKHKNLPPGPRPLPLIGNLHLLFRKDPRKTVVELSKKYGPVLTLHFGTLQFVVLCGYDTIKEAFANHGEDFANRPKLPIMAKTTKDHGVFFSNGENWKAMRRFTISTLRDYGMGRKAIEVKINEEAEVLVKAMKSYEGKPFDNMELLRAAVTNIIISIVVGNQYSSNDPTIRNLMGLINDNINLFSSSLALKLYGLFPSLIDLLPGSHHKLSENIKKMLNIITDLCTKQKKDLDVNDQRSLIDSFLVKQQEGKSEHSKYFHNENLTALVHDLFVAGMDSTTTTLRWAIVLMIKYPEIQRKVQEEIDNVIGTTQPQAEHRKQMPYTDAVIHEIQRVGDIAPGGSPYETTRDVTFRGHFIPKGTTILSCLSSALTDEAYFEKPHEFYPEHFLDAQGNFKGNESFIPFSIGKRSCVGETLAKMELFLFFTSLLQNFTFQAPPGKEVDLTPTFSSLLGPKPQMICAIPRT